MSKEKTTVDLSQYPNTAAAFEQWYVKQPFNWSYSLAFFPKMRFEMQQGVYLAFLREKGIEVWAGPNAAKEGYYSCVMTDSEWESPVETDNYTTVLVAAIETGFARLEAA